MRRECERAATNSISLAIATHAGAGVGGVSEIFDVAWIQLDRAFKVPQSLRPTALAPVRQCGLPVNRWIVRQSAPRKLQLGARPIVLAQAEGQIAGPDEMHFTGIGLELSRLLNNCVRRLKTRGGVIFILVKRKMHPSEFAVSPEKVGIARHGLLEQPYRFTRAHGFGGLPYADCFQVKIVGDQIARGRPRDGGFFALTEILTWS